MKFELTDEEFETLLLALGMAAGAAIRDKNKAMALGIMRLTNTINKDNPRWTPYDVQDLI